MRFTEGTTVGVAVTVKRGNFFFQGFQLIVALLIQVYSMVTKLSTSLSIILFGGGCTLILMDVSSYKCACMVINHMHGRQANKKEHMNRKYVAYIVLSNVKRCNDKYRHNDIDMDRLINI